MPEKCPEKVLRLLTLLKERTEDTSGCTEGEMQAAALKIKELLNEYNLTLMDVGTRQMSVDAVRGDFTSSYSDVPSHCLHLANCIARGFDSKLVYLSGRGSRKAV